ncbi:hypothetical protein ABIB56_000823 [Glaciihabitans sp. UYNi722]
MTHRTSYRRDTHAIVQWWCMRLTAALLLVAAGLLVGHLIEGVR